MKKIYIGGLIFFVGLAFFLLYLPTTTEFMGFEGVGTGQEEGNYSGIQSVNEEPAADAVRRASARLQALEKGREITLVDLSDHEAGDEIDLLIPQEDLSYRGKIVKVDVTAAGNRVLTGFFDAELRRYRFIFTVGESQTFGTIQTAEGRYQLETRNGAGRIISETAINENLDFSKPDYMIPERRKPLGEEVADERGG